MAIRILLTITIEQGYTEEIQSILKTFDEVSSVCIVNHGCYDIIAVVDVESFDSYRTFAIDKIGKLQHIEDYTSFITLDD